MSNQHNRRQFIRSLGLTGLGVWVSGGSWARGNSPNDKVDVACIGVGGKGEGDSNDAGRLGNVVAICDVDDDALNKAAERFPGARKFNDWRKMLDSMAKSIDAVTVSIPDHSHAVAACSAMHLGKHCFCQKPLAHSVWEVRKMSELARTHRIVTQMGNQGTAEDGTRRSAALVRAGAIGKASEVHVWSNRPTWPQGMDVFRPPQIPIPSNLHWDLWLGPAPSRAYGEGYHPNHWRGFWDFGTGALGDMACHSVNMPFMALDLRDPISIQASTAGNNHETYPAWSIITFEFAATPKRPAVTMTWYDGGKRPPAELIPADLRDEHGNLPDCGSIIVGDKGKVFTPGDYGPGGHVIDGVDVGEVSFTHSPGHFEEFINGIKGGPAPVSNFPGYAGPLAETILLGNLAVAAEGKKVLWDARRLRAINAPEVEHIVRPKFRPGYSV